MAFPGGKKNAFHMYMDERKPGIEAAGIVLKSGYADLTEFVGRDWMKLSSEEKVVYKERARKYNENMKQLAAPTPVVRKPQKLPGEHPLAYELRMEKEAERKMFQHECKANCSTVTNFFDTDDWISTPIVICSFSLFFEPNPGALLEDYIPAEIGLTAFSLKDGIIDNFARLIDPGDDIPRVRGLEAYSAVKELGLPSIGSCEELKEYEALADGIESFLERNAEISDGDYYVFALSRDLEKVNGCMQWISEASGHLIPIKVLNLSLWGHLGSTQNNKRYRQKTNAEPVEAANRSSRGPQSMMADTLRKLMDAGILAVQTSTYRTVGSSLTSTFVYPSEFPLSKSGVFLAEEDVDNIIQKTTSYKYYDEICCMYHMKKREGVEKCALNVSNSHAFCLLEFLTMSNRITNIRPSFHFPTVTDLPEERKRRIRMLKRWGFTKLELKMRDENLEKHQFETEQRLELENLRVSARPNSGEGQRRHRAHEGRPSTKGPRRGANSVAARDEVAEFSFTEDELTHVTSRYFKK